MTSQKGGGDVSPVKPQIHKERDRVVGGCGYKAQLINCQLSRFSTARRCVTSFPGLDSTRFKRLSILFIHLKASNV